MCGKIYTWVAVIIAVVLAILAVLLPVERLHDFILIMRFFETMIPVLGVAALIKYICHGHKCGVCKAKCE